MVETLDNIIMANQNKDIKLDAFDIAIAIKTQMDIDNERSLNKEEKTLLTKILEICLQRECMLCKAHGHEKNKCPLLKSINKRASELNVRK